MTRRQLIGRVRKSVWSLHCMVTDPKTIQKLPTTALDRIRLGSITSLEDIEQELVTIELEIEQSL